MDRAFGRLGGRRSGPHVPMVGGMVSSTVLTLLVIPALYYDRERVEAGRGPLGVNVMWTVPDPRH